MDTLNDLKKASHQDWHPAVIVAALRLQGWSLRRLSAHLGLSASTLKNAMHKPYPKAEKQIAKVIGMEPWVIWPSRYAVSRDEAGNMLGVPNRGLPGRKAGSDYHTHSKNPHNVKRRKVA